MGSKVLDLPKLAGTFAKPLSRCSLLSHNGIIRARNRRRLKRRTDGLRD